MRKVRKWLGRIFILLLAFGTITKIYFEIGNMQFEKEYAELLLPLPEQPLTEKIIEGDNMHFYYYMAGKEGAPLILFLHPAFTDHTAFNPQFDAIGAHYRIAAVDLIGHGNSQGKNDEGIDASVKYIHKIIAAEGYKNVHLVGVSVGSLIAQQYAIDYPTEVLSLTAVGAYPIHVADKRVKETQRKHNFKAVFRALFSMKAFRRYSAQVSTHSPSATWQFYHSAEKFTRRSFPKMQGLSNILKEREAPTIDYPTLLMTGEHDLELAKEMAYDWHKQLPLSTYYEIENAGHCINLDQPDIFNRILLQFLANIE